MKRILALVLSTSLLLSGCGAAPEYTEGPGAANAAPLQLADPAYPAMAQRPDPSDDTEKSYSAYDSAYAAWLDDQMAQWQQPTGYDECLTPYLDAIVPALFPDSSENQVYSPLSIYIALGMLAETAGGETQAQILSLLGMDCLDTLRQEVSALWNANYCDDGVSNVLLADSLWLSDGLDYHSDTLDSLAKNYYAAVFQGTMGDPAYDGMLQQWVNDQTGNLLEEQASQLSMDPGTTAALVNTVYFRSGWSEEFSPAQTSPDTFHAKDGDMTCDFMHASSSQTYYQGESFTGISRGFDNGCSMWFLLPDEDTAPAALLRDPSLMTLFAGDNSGIQSKFLTVNAAVPKFDIASEHELSDTLKSLGITNAFSPETADFSALSDGDAVLSSIQHAARMTIDEEGATAAAFTVAMEEGAAMPPEEETDFILNRPFVVAITTRDGLPLFLGIVNTPS